ncbi:MAG: hypothetical protein ACLPY5_06325 [Candidatus Bathyarchaeia archaeon]
MPEEKLPDLFQGIGRVIHARLIGQSYSTLSLATCYFICGNLLHRNLIQLGAIQTDSRLNLLIAIMPGGGKTTLKDLIKYLMDGIAILRLPTTIHPDQLLGRVTRRGNQSFKKKGYFADPFILFDESLPWIQRNDNLAERFWSHVNVALDTYGHNMIEKDLVDDLPNEKLEPYPAECSIIFFMQQEWVPHSFLSRGVVRRLVPIVIDISEQEYREIVQGRTNSAPADPALIGNLKKTLKVLHDLSVNWTFTEEAKNAVTKYTLELHKFSQSHSSKLVKEYGNAMRLTFGDRLCAMSAVLAAAEAVYDQDPARFASDDWSDDSLIAQVQIRAEHVDLASKHLRIFMESCFEFVERFVKSGHSSVSIVTERERNALKILKNSECVSKEKSTLSVRGYQEEIAKQLPCNLSVAKGIYKSLKRKGLAKSAQTGQHTTITWITQLGIETIAS